MISFRREALALKWPGGQAGPPQIWRRSGVNMVLRALWLAIGLAPAFAAVAAPRPALLGKPWTGVVSYVTDGDTLWVRPQDGGPPRKLRLEGIDAPEICQAYGAAARDALARRVLDRPVLVTTRAIDDYQRGLANLRLHGEDVNGWMVAQGHAWSYRYRGDAGPYAGPERRARAASRGLFAQPGAERPRDFRKRHGSCHSAPA